MFRQKPFCSLINIYRFPIQRLAVISELMRTMLYAFEKGMKDKINLIDRRFLEKYWIRRFFLMLRGLSSGISFFGSEREATRRHSERHSLSSLPETEILS